MLYATFCPNSKAIGKTWGDIYLSFRKFKIRKKLHILHWFQKYKLAFVMKLCPVFDIAGLKMLKTVSGNCASDTIPSCYVSNTSQLARRMGWVEGTLILSKLGPM
jgi:hypothetical protein